MKREYDQALPLLEEATYILSTYYQGGDKFSATVMSFLADTYELLGRWRDAVSIDLRLKEHHFHPRGHYRMAKDMVIKVRGPAS